MMTKIKVESCWFGIWRTDMYDVTEQELYDFCNTPGLKIEIASAPTTAPEAINTK
jgi:hypothetical protein